jgi:acyl-CoA reductase-like NAD-dependent aldehyde dehydrogenase
MDRMLTASWMMKSAEYMKWAFGEERVETDIIEGVGTVGIIIQSSMFQTGAYGIIDALRAGNGVLVKLDSRDPYPEYLVGSSLAEAGAPIQVISVDTRTKPNIGRKIIDGLDKVVFMGNPYKVVEIAYGEAIQQLTASGGITSADIDSLRKKLLIPAKVISYTAHLGGAYMDRSADIEAAIRMCGYSATSHYRSCKRLKVLTIHPDVYAEALSLLKGMFSNLKIGSTTDPDAHIVETNDAYWERFVGPYLEETRKYGEVVCGGEERSAPKIIELNTEQLPQGGGIDRYLGEECMFPLLIVIKGDENIGIYATKVMAENSHDGMILEYAVFTENRDIFRFIEKHGYAFNYHLNEPTTWGLGNPEKNRFRFHQRRILAMDLAGTRVG